MLSPADSNIPLQDVYSATFENKFASNIHVAVTYRAFDEIPNVVVEADIPAGASHTFEQKTFTEGTATLTFSISKVAVTAAGKTVEKAEPFPDVTSPVKDYKFGFSDKAKITASL